MKQETLKKIVELADGFSIAKPNGIYSFRLTDEFLTPRQFHIFIDTETLLKHSSYYPLLLSRAEQGWNRQKHIDYRILINRHGVYITNKLGITMKTILYMDQQPTENLTPEELAIEKILIFLLETK